MVGALTTLRTTRCASAKRGRCSERARAIGRGHQAHRRHRQQREEDAPHRASVVTLGHRAAQVEQAADVEYPAIELRPATTRAAHGSAPRTHPFAHGHAAERVEHATSESSSGTVSALSGPRICRATRPWPCTRSFSPTGQLAVPQTAHARGRTSETPGVARSHDLIPTVEQITLRLLCVTKPRSTMASGLRQERRSPSPFPSAPRRCSAPRAPSVRSRAPMGSCTQPRAKRALRRWLNRGHGDLQGPPGGSTQLWHPRRRHGTTRRATSIDSRSHRAERARRWRAASSPARWVVPEHTARITSTGGAEKHAAPAKQRSA